MCKVFKGQSVGDQKRAKGGSVAGWQRTVKGKQCGDRELEHGNAKAEDDDDGDGGEGFLGVAKFAGVVVGLVGGLAGLAEPGFG